MSGSFTRHGSWRIEVEEEAAGEGENIYKLHVAKAAEGRVGIMHGVDS